MISARTLRKQKKKVGGTGMCGWVCLGVSPRRGLIILLSKIVHTIPPLQLAYPSVHQRTRHLDSRHPTLQAQKQHKTLLAASDNAAVASKKGAEGSWSCASDRSGAFPVLPDVVDHSSCATTRHARNAGKISRHE